MSGIKSIAALFLLSGMLLFVAGCAGVLDREVKIDPDGTGSSEIKARDNFPDGEHAGYRLAAENEAYALYFEETGLTVLVKDKRTGQVMDSAGMPDENSSAAWKNFVNSGVVIEYFKGKATTINRLDMYSDSPKTEVYPVEDGFAAKVHFKSVGIKLTVFVTLTESGLQVQVPGSSIEETDENYKLAAAYVLPYLGSTRGDETEGYMLIPDGCGAIIRLADNHEKYSQPYKAKVYSGNYSIEENRGAVQKFEGEIATMSDSEPIAAPVFGMVHTDKGMGFLGIIEEGKYNAELYAYPGSVITEYNWITARYVYREVYLYPTSQTKGINTIQAERETFDVLVRYDFVSGEEADYTGLAVAYRDYLWKNGVLGRVASDYSVRLDFFAGDQEKALIGKSFVAMTTVEDMDHMLEALTEDGVERITAVYKGWQKNGTYGTMKDKIRFEKGLGCLSDYTDLTEKYSDQVRFLLYGDFMNSYSKNSSADYIYRYNGKIFSDDTFLELNPVKYRYTSRYSADLIRDYDHQLAGTDVGLAIDGVTNQCFSAMVNNKKDLYSRQSYARDIQEALRGLESAAYYSPNDYLWSETESYFDFKLYGSGYKFVSQEIPFFAIALKGSMGLYSEYVNFEADATEYLLRMVESGVYPSFLLTSKNPSEMIYTDSASLYSCEYGEYAALIKEYYDTFLALHQSTEGAYITDYEKQSGVSKVTYSNGTQVFVNFNKEESQHWGRVLAPLSYSIEKGEGV